MSKQAERVGLGGVEQLAERGSGLRDRVSRWGIWSLGLLIWGVQSYAARTGLEPHVVGGNTVEAAAYPWMVAIVRSDDPAVYRGFVSGATLIHPSWALTAAHSVDGLGPEDIELLIGVDSLLVPGNVPRRRVSSIVRHPRYDHGSETAGFDLALLRLEEPVLETPTLPVSPQPSLPRAGARTRAIGWGRTTHNGFRSTTLQSVDLPIMAKADVDVAALYGGELPADVFLAGYAEGGKDTCEGDSGGPLLDRDPQSGAWRLLGVILGGARRGCAVAGAFGLYTSVAAHCGWIESVLVRSYGDWARLHDVGDPRADQDGDQFTNWDEYALMSRPRNSDSRPRLVSSLVFVEEIGYPALGGAIRRGSLDLEYSVMVSADMVDWRVVATLPQQDANMDTMSGSHFLWRSPVPLLGEQPLFIRLFAGRQVANLGLGSGQRPVRLDLANR